MARLNKQTMTLEGLEPLKALVAKTPDLVKLFMGDVVSSTAYGVAQRAKALVPVATGSLKRSITFTARGLNGRIGIASTEIFEGDRRPDVYWRFVEFGTVRVPARPFFRPATEAESVDFERRIRGVATKIERDLSGGRFT